MAPPNRRAQIVDEYETLEHQLADPEVLADPDLLRTASKRYNELGPVVAKVRRYEPEEKGHGRRETRWYYLCPVPDDLPDRGRWAKLKAIGIQNKTTPFMILLAGYMVLLQLYSGEHDISVGTPMANRGSSETEGLIGFFDAKRKYR